MLRLENLELVHLSRQQHDNDTIDEVDDNTGFSDDSDDDKLDGVGDSRSWSSGGGGSSVATSKLRVNILEYWGICGNIWKYFGIFWNVWEYLGIFGNIWEYSEIFGNIWEYSEIFGNIW